MIKGNKVYLTRDLHTSNNGSPVVSGAVLSEKPLLYCLINFSQARKQVYKNFFEQKPKKQCFTHCFLRCCCFTIFVSCSRLRYKKMMITIN